MGPIDAVHQSTEGLGRRDPPTRRARWGLLVAVALLLAIPPGLSVGAAAAGPPHAVPMPPVRPAVGGIPSASRTLPGADPLHERFLDAAALALAEWQAEVRQLPKNHASAPSIVPGSILTSPRAVPRPGSQPNGTVTGTVFDATYGRALGGADVQVEPFGTTICSSVCANGTTASNGSFSLPAPAGAVTVVVSDAYYIANRTWVTVPSGGRVSVGNFFLIHDGFVTGVLEDDTPAHRPIGNVTITATSRDGATGTYPDNVSLGNGSFRVAVPPVPTDVRFTPNGNPAPYLANDTWVNLTPYAQVNVGVVYLEGGISVHAELYDSVTGRPIASQAPAQLVVCTRRTDLCLSSILQETGPNVSGYALPGPASLKVYAIGYVTNLTTIPDVPNVAAPVDLGRIDLLPLAGYELSSNLTGGMPSSSAWPLGDLLVEVCSLSGLQVTFQITTNSTLLGAPCWPRGVNFPFITANTFPVGNTSVVLGPPLRVGIFLAVNNVNALPPPGTFPYAEAGVSSLTPLFPAFYANLTWANGSPDRVTPVGSVDVTPGTYVDGNVSIRGVSGSLADAFEVQVCSTDEPSVCGLAVNASVGQPSVAGCPATNVSFCAPAPPGPDVVTIFELGDQAENRTWVTAPSGCCAQDGHPLDIGWLNLTAPALYGSVNGSAVATTGGFGSGTTPLLGVIGVVQACPVGPPLTGLPAPACTASAVNLSTGAFNLSAPLGWDRVLVSATGYTSNWTWIDVTGANRSGVIELAPVADLVGEVVSATGGPVYSAIVEACPAATTNLCSTLGVTSTNGQYNGTLRGGPFVANVYEVEAFASGFATSWTWVNATPGRVVPVPTIRLAPIGSGPVAPAAPASPNASVGAWVDGRIVDARTGLGIPNAIINECSVVGSGCLGAIAFTTAGGTFNVSLLLGQYYLEFQAVGYPTGAAYVNATATEVVHLGTVAMTADPWVSGRILIAPWESLASSDLGAPAIVTGCNSTTGSCGLTGLTNTAGFFNVSVPAGAASTLLLTGNGIAGFGSPGQGFDSARLSVDAVAPFTELPTSGANVPTLAIFGSLAGRLRDGTEGNGALAAPSEPCGFCNVIATDVGGRQTSYTVTQVGGGGNYTIFLPSDGNATEITGAGASFWWVNETIAGPVVAGSAGATPDLALTHYGWIHVRVVDANGSGPLPFAMVTASVSDPANRTTWITTTAVDGGGFANLTAPPGRSGTVLVTAPTHTNRTLHVAVTPSVASGLGNVSLTGSTVPTEVEIRGTEVNTVEGPPTPTVRDPVAGVPVSGALVVAGTVSGTTAPGLYTNGLGQFLLFAPTASVLALTVNAPAFSLWTSYWNTSGRSRLVIPSINLSANGIVAGRLVAEPSGVAAYDQTVEVCPATNPGCLNFALSNSTGDFWVSAPSGRDVLSVATNSFLFNSTIAITVPADGWTDVGTIPLFELATVRGVVRALPSGVPLPNASVYLCSPLGVPAGPCGFGLPTGPDGSFSIPSPPGLFVLAVAAPGFNTSYLPLALGPGVNVSVGTVLLEADGIVTGTAVSAISGAPVPNVTALACATYRTNDCTTTPAAEDGAFDFLAPPGPVVLTVSAPGYADAVLSIVVPIGWSIDLGTLALAPLAADIPESVSGGVAVAGPASVPIPNAFLAASEGGVRVASTTTNASGGYRLAVSWGTYTITASAAGYHASATVLFVHANLTGIDFALDPFNYTFSGTVTDSAGTPLAGVALDLGATTLATTNGRGAFAMALVNGTYTLTAEAPNGTGASGFAPLTFSVAINGAPVTRTLTLASTGALVVGLVVDALTGLPIPTAALSVDRPGSLTPVLTTGVSAGGAFRLALGIGTFVVNVSAAGYQTASVTVTVPGTAGPLTIALEPAVAVTGSGSPLLPLALGGAVAAVAAAALVTVLLLRRRRAPPAPALPRWTDEDAPAPVGDDEGTLLP